MKLRLIVCKRAPAAAGMFGYPPVPRQHIGFGLFVSCALHGAFIAALSAAAYWHRPAVPWIPAGYTVEMLRVVVPPRLYYPRQQTRESSAAAPRSVAAARTAIARATVRPAASAMVRLPDRAARLRSAVVLIQPELSRNPVPPDLRLPDLFAWSRHDAVVPPAPIVPGHAENAAGRPSATPVLQPSKLQDWVGQLNVEPRAAKSVPALPMPPQTTTPVGFAGAQGFESNRRVSLDTRNADPANLMASSEHSPRPGEVISVPAGVNAAAGSPEGRASAAPASPETRASAAPDATRRTTQQAAQQPSAPQPANREAASAPPRESSNPGHRIATVRTAAGDPVIVSAGGQSATQSHDSGPRPPAPATVSAPATAAAPEPPPGVRFENAIWKEHPKGGQFDVVVVQASSSPDTREAGFVLGGPQVYTVYVEVGTERPWVLQFCKPADAVVEQSQSGVVRITAGERIQAPYPILTAAPTPALLAASAKIYVRGFLNVEGRLEDLSVHGLAGAAAHELVALLGRWRFRPALEGDRTLRVEVLFTIPAVNG